MRPKTLVDTGAETLANNEILAAFAITMRELLPLCGQAGVHLNIATQLFTGTFALGVGQDATSRS